MPEEETEYKEAPSHPSWVCGLKLHYAVSTDYVEEVTPFVGVWIETASTWPKKRECRSHPSWVCGLKPLVSVYNISATWVTPFVGVWIETVTNAGLITSKNSHTLRGCVDWNTPDGSLYLWISVTPFVGVWIETQANGSTNRFIPSHPSWVCGLKLTFLDKMCVHFACHTLRGCVDWNLCRHEERKVLRRVTPFVGVWIET